MVITSDNTATDIAIAKVGGTAAVNAWLRESGYGDALQLTMTTGELFAKYRQTPEFRLVNFDMTLEGFKTIFWWEWSHRLLGRVIGAVRSFYGR